MSVKRLSFQKCKDLILGIVMLVFSGFYYYVSTQIKTRPKLVPSYSNAQVMPQLLGILLAAMSVFLIVQGVKRLRDKSVDTEETKLGKGDITAVALTFAMIVAYITMMTMGLGFCISTMVYLFLQILVLSPKEKRNYWLFAIVAVVFTMFVFVTFRIGLQQLLPRGPIESLLGF